jgi:transposase
LWQEKQRVITMALMGKIRGMHFRDGKSISEISRLTSLSRNTIKKWLKVPQGTQPKYRRPEVPTKLTPFVEALTLALQADAHRPKHERRTALALHAELQTLGYPGGYTRLTQFIRQWRQKLGKVSSTTAFVPLKFDLGDAFQFDWSEEGLVVGGIHYRMQVAQMKLCASRAFWLVAYPSQGHEMLFDAHTRSFTALGGIPRRGIYDNMTTAVDKVKKGKGRIVNARFAVMCAHLYDPDTGPRRGPFVAHATSPAVGRRPSSRRTCRTAAGASGWTPASCALAPSWNSTPGWATAAAPCGASCATPSTTSSAWPRCSSTNCRT